MKKIIFILSVMLLSLSSCSKPKLTLKVSDETLRCKACKGYGEIIIEDKFLIFPDYKTQSCMVCHGSGKKWVSPINPHVDPSIPDDNPGVDPEPGEWEPQKIIVDCNLCGGTRMCGVCGGLGLLWRNGGYIDCTNCNGNQYCPYCEGTGKQEQYIF